MRDGISILVVRPDQCTGCRSCEVMCSFHHDRVFEPGRSSIAVRRDDQSGEVVLKVATDCDGCETETMPLCVRVCVRGVLAQAVLQQNG